MIKIIKKGHIYKEAECRKCGCIFQYEEEDVIEDESNYIDNHGVAWGSDFLIKEGCPFCGSSVILGPDNPFRGKK